MTGNFKRTLCVILAVILTVSCFSSAAFAWSGRIDQEIIAKSREICTQIEAEGMVMLKNEDNVLPLGEKKVNIFGAGSVCPFYGGAGSGAVTTENPTSFYDALDEMKVNYNTELRALYEKNCSSRTQDIKTDNTVINNLLQLALQESSIKEMAVSKLTDSIMKNAIAFSDTAIIMISRTSAENSDLSRSTLQLTEAEKKLVEKVTSSFANVVILFNTGNVMEMGWLENYENIKSAAIIWIPGEFGMSGVAKVLKGEISPSGRLNDTITYNVTDHPSSNCFGNYTYTGADEHYVQYMEGIYVGYRYFETFAKDKVQYPFGYGISYTTFDKEITSFSADSREISMSVKVTNTGDAEGKETVQVYYSAPYYENGLEKSSVVLGGFAKTKTLKPGESETVTVTYKTDDMASYDRGANQAYCLDKGEYKIYLADNARDIIDTRTYTQAENKIIKNDAVTGTEIKNLFDSAYNGFTILSRSNPEGTYPVANQLVADEAVKNMDQNPEPVKEGAAPKTGVKYDKTITLQDVAADESLWDAFLDQLTVDEMTMMVIDGGYETHGVDRLGIPHTWDNDGPSSIKGRNGLVYTDCGAAYPCETAIACTWNLDLAEEMGKSVGREAYDIGADIWYAPGVNIHRNPMAGRNFEYFSEDPVVSGLMAAAVINGAQSEGLQVTIKHYALNDQETNRGGILTWCDEQAMREIYLKAFEIPVKATKCVGVMSAYSRIGTDWCGGSSALLNDLLRKEWGFEGFVVSDYSSNFTGKGYMNPVTAVYNGNDTILTGIWFLNLPSNYIAVRMAYNRDPIGFGTALRQACKNLCIAKMHTRAFLDPDTSYDASIIGAMEKPDEWEWSAPYGFSALRYVVNNIANAVIFLFRYIL